MDLTQSISMFAQIKYYSWRLTNYYNVTEIHPLAGMILVAVVMSIFLLPRKYVIPAALVALIYTSSAQRLVVFGVDFNFARIICVTGLLRVIVRGEFANIRWSLPDTLVLGYSILRLIGAIVRGQGDRIMGEAGWAFDQFAAYLIGRSVLRDPKSWGPTIRFACVIMVPVAIFFLREKITGRNAFHVFGGVPEMTLVREGKMRAQGAFPHAIIAGAWFVSFLPLLLSQWKSDARRNRGIAVALIGSVSCLTIIFSANASTPFAGLLAVGIGFALFPLRKFFGKMAWVLLFMAIVLHFISGNGVFHLMFARFSFAVGSTGFHRYLLYDAWLNMIPEWFIAGSTSTAHWGRRLFDVTSEYVGASVRGGMLGFVSLIGILVCSFKSVAKATSIAKGTREEIFLYSLGVMLFAHTVMFLGVQYFGSVVFWFWLSIGSMISIGYGLQPQMARTPVNRNTRSVYQVSPMRPMRRNHTSRPPSGTAGEGI